MKLSFLSQELSRNYHYKHRKITSSTYPDIAAIEITNFCNQRCIICPHSNMTRKKEHMRFEVFKKIIDEIRSYPQNITWLHVFGEPLLHPKVFDFVNYAKKSGLTIGFSTNCMLLDKENHNILQKDNHFHIQ